ncbi:Cupin [Paenibacillaceae bacterium GAS479]|nr:Cupin [Paenibacillaceae bacterium GAS479]
MTISYMDYTNPNLTFTYDMRNNTVSKTNDQNYFNLLGYKQLPTLGSASLLDIFMSKGHFVEPHYHQNASELVYLVSGTVTVSMINPFTGKLISIPITPQQVVVVPQGWWHFEEATSDNTHILAVFDAPTPQVILGSDILRLTPTNVMAETYCLDEAQYKAAISPITQTVGIGPLDNCQKNRELDEFRSAEQEEAPPVGISAYGTAPHWAGTSVSGQPAFLYSQTPYRTQAPSYYPQPYFPQPTYGQMQGYAQPYAQQPTAFAQTYFPAYGQQPYSQQSTTQAAYANPYQFGAPQAPVGYR